MAEIARFVPAYEGITYQELAVNSVNGTPPRRDLYYSGTVYVNRQGLGIQLPSAAERGEKVVIEKPPVYRLKAAGKDEILVLPCSALLDRSSLLSASTLLEKRLCGAVLRMNPRLAARHNLVGGSMVGLNIDGLSHPLRVELDDSLPEKAAFLPRLAGIPLREPGVFRLTPKEELLPSR